MWPGGNSRRATFTTRGGDRRSRADSVVTVRGCLVVSSHGARAAYARRRARGVRQTSWTIGRHRPSQLDDRLPLRRGCGPGRSGPSESPLIGSGSVWAVWGGPGAASVAYPVEEGVGQWWSARVAVSGVPPDRVRDRRGGRGSRAAELWNSSRPRRWDRGAQGVSQLSQPPGRKPHQRHRHRDGGHRHTSPPGQAGVALSRVWAQTKGGPAGKVPAGPRFVPTPLGVRCHRRC